jgi:hypothetical protein
VSLPICAVVCQTGLVPGNVTSPCNSIELIRTLTFTRKSIGKAVLFALITMMYFAIPAFGAATKTRETAKRLPRKIYFAVVVDPQVGATVEEARVVIGEILGDPRSWRSLKPVTFVLAPVEKAKLVVHILTPDQVDLACQPLSTDGVKSCSKRWNVYLNGDRWTKGAEPSKMRLAQYRRYLVNHEVGHSLGEPHRKCPGKGRMAPVMLQQTIGLQGCRPNPWPYPQGGAKANVANPTTTTTTTTSIPDTTKSSAVDD